MAVHAVFMSSGAFLWLGSTCVTIINGKDEFTIKLVRLMDEVNGCNVAFIPCILMDLPFVQKNILQFCGNRALPCFQK
jgi:hypothetical protein